MRNKPIISARLHSSFTALLLLALSTGAAADRTPVQVPTTTDLNADARLAARKGVPILLVFSATHCSYCELLEAEILRPMLLSGDYTDQVIIRKVLIDEDHTLRDFDGRPVSTANFVSRYGVFVTPTMVLLDPRGRELADRLVGINTVEMFGGLVDAAISAALERLHQRTRTGKTLASNSSRQ